MAFQGRGQQGRTSQSSEREPADSLRDESNVIGGWLPSLTFAFAVESPLDNAGITG
jgi:hypothetical protein